MDRRIRRGLLAVATAASLLGGAPAEPAGAQVATNLVSGDLGSGDTIWTPDESPYVLTGDVTVPDGGRLYVAPGTTVTSEDDHQLIVNGEIRTDGATFDLPGGVVVDPTVVPTGPARAVFSTTTFRNATGAALSVERGDADVTYSAFVDNGTAVVGGTDPRTIRLLHVRLSGNETVADVNAQYFLLADSHISDFVRGAIADQLTFINNVVVPPGGPCQADGTGCAAALRGTREVSSSINATWFGTADPDAVQALIWDSADDASLQAFDGTPATGGQDLEPPVATIESPGATVRSTVGLLEGDAVDTPLGGLGVGRVDVWVFDATDTTVWNGTGWVDPRPSDLDDPPPLAAATGTTEWSLTLPELTVGHRYVTVAFATEAGGNPTTGVSTPTTFRVVDASGIPTITSTAVQPDRSVIVSWAPPADTGGADVDTYELVCTPDPQPPLGDLDPEVKVVAGTTTSTTIEPAIAVTYTCTVTATTTIGTGPASAPATVTVVAPAPTFSDVPTGTFFTTPVGWAQAIGLTTGVGGTNQFQPLRDISRAETITLLWRHAGSPTGFAPHGFDDASATAYYSAALDWARAQGLTTGVGGTNTFQPDRTITRAETTTLLWRIAGSPTGLAPHGFDDASASAFYSAALDWARAHGLTTGVAGTNTFQPDRTITRAETITLLHRAATGA